MLLLTKPSSAVAFVSDIHFPYEDVAALSGAEDVMRALRPSTIIVGGDLLDFEEVSFYDKDPHRTAPLQDEIDQGRAWLENLRAKHPGAQIVYLAGNHEDRLRRWLQKHGGLASLRCLKVEALLQLDKLKIRYVEYDKGWKYEGVLFRHGKSCGVTAGRKNLQQAMCSGVSGHTHKLSLDTINTPGAGVVSWVQAGCLCGEMPYWVEQPSQVHGMAVGWRVSGELTMQPLRIINGEPAAGGY